MPHILFSGQKNHINLITQPSRGIQKERVESFSRAPNIGVFRHHGLIMCNTARLVDNLVTSHQYLLFQNKAYHKQTKCHKLKIK